MITVLSINKRGNKIESYTCTDGLKTINISKDILIGHIKNKQVTNATI